MSEGSRDGLNLLHELRSVLQSSDYTSTEKRLADYVIKHGHEMHDMNIKDVAVEVGVSHAMIVKFCKHIGFTGFADLKAILRTHCWNRAEEVFQELDRRDTPQDIIEKVFHNAIQDFQDSLAVINRTTFAEVVDCVQKARSTSFFAVGGSGSVAIDAHHKFMLIGLPSHVYTDSHLQAMHAALLKEGDVVFGISYSGYTKEIVKALELARSQGAVTVCLTNYRHSPITQVSDYVLFSSTRGTPLMGENATARLVQMNVMSALVAAIAAKNYDLVIGRMRKTIDAVSSSRL